MVSYSQLFVRYLISALLLSCVFGFVSFYITNQHVDTIQTNKAELARHFINTSSKEELPQTIQQIIHNKLALSISINDESGKTIASQQLSPHWLTALFSVKESQLKIKDKQLTVNFIPNVNSSAQNLVMSISAFLFLSILVAFILPSRAIKRNKALLEVVDHQIKLQLHKTLTTPLKDNTEGKAQSSINLPALTAGVNEISARINNHIADTSTLEKEAYFDPLTQLANRTRFVQYFEDKNDHVDFGVLTITRCSELQTINQIHGYHEGDTYIRKIAEIINKAASHFKSANVFRLNSSDFATILPNTTLKDAESFAKDLTSKFNDYQQASDLDSIGYTGLVYFDQTNPLGELLALADTGISVAQTQQINAWHAQTDTDILTNASSTYGNQNWRQEINNVIENQRVNLLIQHIKPNTRNDKVYSEVLARFLNANDEMLPTASFIAMAEKLDKIVEVDRLIIEQAMLQINEKNLTDQFFGINVSARSIQDEQFMIWLERRLLREPNVSSKLIFEITEYGLQQNIKTSKQFIDMIHRVGSRVTVERFGVGLTSFKFFRDLKPDFIKMDSTYTRDIDEDKNNQYFLRLMIDLAHRLSISVLAESVESQEEKYTLEKLFIDGCQGFYIGKPEAL